MPRRKSKNSRNWSVEHDHSDSREEILSGVQLNQGIEVLAFYDHLTAKQHVLEGGDGLN
jgi:hypothetical protein